MNRPAPDSLRALVETDCYQPPSYPPPADERAITANYEPVNVPVFFGTRCCHDARLPLPATSQHASTEAFHALESTLDLGPKSCAAAPTAARGIVPVPRRTSEKSEARSAGAVPLSSEVRVVEVDDACTLATAINSQSGERLVVGGGGTAAGGVR